MGRDLLPKMKDEQKGATVSGLTKSFDPLGKAVDLSMNNYGAAGRHSLPFVGLLAPKKIAPDR